MAQSLCMSEKDMEMTNALALFGSDMIDVLYPDREDVGDPIVSNPGHWQHSRSIPDTVPLALPQEMISLNRLPRADPGIGSNNWVLAGSKTATGSPLLCGDPHLNLNMPAIWYAIQLHTPLSNVIGASLPGTPAVVIGANDSIAWSVTNAQRDLVDWYRITFQDSKRQHYLLDGEWVATIKSIENIKVRDHAVVRDTVVYTEWGPVTYDDNFHPEDNRKQYAFRWIAHDPSHELGGLYKLNRASNLKAFDEALQTYSSPALNFAFATTHGDIGMRIAGRFPVRRHNEGRFVLDGSQRSYGWQSFIPAEDQITSLNPSRGFESSANQYPVDSSYPYYITATRFEAYRNRHINARLSEFTAATPEDMMAMQMDPFSLMAAENLPWMLAELDSTSLAADQKRIARALSKWDFMNAPDKIMPTYFAFWIRNVLALAWDEMSDDKLMLDRPTTFTTLKLLKSTPDLPYFDIRATPEKENAHDLVRRSFEIAIEDVTKWIATHQNSEPIWNDVKGSHASHLLRIGPLGEPVNGGGSADAINALSPVHGPSWRMVVSLEPAGVRMWMTYPGGQSGNAGSIFYNNLIPSWEQGHHKPLPMFRNTHEARKRQLYTLLISKP
jgi:penicillin amidase